MVQASKLSSLSRLVIASRGPEDGDEVRLARGDL